METLSRAISLSQSTRLMIAISSDNMIGAGILPGDDVEIRVQNTATPGDIVVASIEGEFSLNTYCVTDDNQVWLVPENPNYQPICMAQCQSVVIVGQVVRIIKHDIPRGHLQMALNRIMQERRDRCYDQISPEAIRRALTEVAPLISCKRQWFAVYAVLHQHNLVCSYHAFGHLLDRLLADKAPALNLNELSRMEVLSFARPVSCWDPDNAPVSGQRFNQYLSIAQMFSRELFSYPSQ